MVDQVMELLVRQEPAVPVPVCKASNPVLQASACLWPITAGLAVMEASRAASARRGASVVMALGSTIQESLAWITPRSRIILLVREDRVLLVMAVIMAVAEATAAVVPIVGASALRFVFSMETSPEVAVMVAMGYLGVEAEWAVQ